ncbi:MAG: hypothetical protein D6737_00175 [Chloroflexi bacterium]|nr:MAG: hypothetical protein D6737_00175 [Chloroflexota bacterium]
MSAIFIILLAMFFGLGAATAQPTTVPIFCGELSESDCALLMTSQDAMETVTAATFDFDMVFDFTTDDGSFSINMGMDGRYRVPEGYATLFDTDAFASQDAAELLNTFSDVLGNVDAVVMIDMGAQDNLSTVGGPPFEFNMEVRMTDGITYINPGVFGALFGVQSGWTGFDIAGLYRDLANDPALADSSDLSQISPIFGVTGFNDFGLFEPEFLSAFVSVERVANSQINGQPVAVFVASVDPQAFVSEMTVRDTLHTAINEIFAQINQNTGAFGGDLMLERAAFDNAFDFVAPLADNVALSITQQIDLENNFRRATTVQVTVDIDRDTLLALGDNFATSEPFALQIEFNFVFDDFNDVAPVEAPPNAVIQPLDQLFGGAGAGSF